jgi:hypothetical protein
MTGCLYGSKFSRHASLKLAVSDIQTPADHVHSCLCTHGGNSTTACAMISQRAGVAVKAGSHKEQTYELHPAPTMHVLLVRVKSHLLAS